MEHVKSFFSGLARHHYWLLAVVVPILLIWAWSGMANTLDTNIRSRKNEIDGAINKIKTTAGPNDKWIERAKQLNEINETQQDASIEKLFRSQKIKFQWPESVASRVAEMELKYRQQFSDYEILREFAGSIPKSGQRQPNGYHNELTKVVNSLEPYDDITKTGKVILTPGNIVKPFPGAEAWLPTENAVIPTDLEIWDALEDLSLNTTIVEAIRNINSSAISIGESPIKMIHEIRLVGGTFSNFRDPSGYEDVAIASTGGGGGDINRQILQKVADAGGSASRGKRDKFESEIREEQAAQNAPSGGTQLRVTNLGGNQAHFEVSMQFGGARPDTESEAYKQAQKRKEEQAKAAAAALNQDSDRGGADQEKMMEEFLKERAKANAPALDKIAIDTETFVRRKGDRYIDFDETKPYVTRGFYIELTIDHRKLPELLGNLTNMQYPTVVARVQSVSRKHNQSDFTSRSSEGPGSGSRSRRDDDEEEQEAPTSPNQPNATNTTPQVEDNINDTLLADPYLSDVAIAGYMAVFKLETMMDKLNPEETAPAEGDSDKPADKEPGELNRSQPAINRTESNNGRE
ncbi:MAG: hypothetical protein KDA65_09065 [Planctomycetaceae bacterium]|nr:hypothetical protein [Planctomycetaceae bacterium]